MVAQIKENNVLQMKDFKVYLNYPKHVYSEEVSSTVFLSGKCANDKSA